MKPIAVGLTCVKLIRQTRPDHVYYSIILSSIAPVASFNTHEEYVPFHSTSSPDTLQIECPPAGIMGIS